MASVPPPADRPPRRHLVVLEESVLTALAFNPTAVREFPFLSSLAELSRDQRQGCNCGGASAHSRAAVFQSVKATLAGLPDDRRRRLKEILNADTVQVFYRDASGATRQVTF